jgi:ribonuclease Y
MHITIQTVLIWIGAGAAVGTAAFWLGYTVRRRIAESKIKTAETIAEKIIDEAQRESDNVKRAAVLEARDEALKQKEIVEGELDSKRKELRDEENRIYQKTQNLKNREGELAKLDQQLHSRKNTINDRDKALKIKEEALAKKTEEQNRMLERVSGMTAEEAKKILMDNLVSQVEHEAARTIKEVKERAIQEGEREARNIISQAIQRCASDHTVETTVSVVELPNDEMKGRIIGREGRNIRSIEAECGVDLIVDDTPGAVIISSFDQVRREIARQSLETLITDGRIHPGRVEEIVAKCRKEMDEHLAQVGEDTLFEINVSDTHPDLAKVLGRLKYRTSYGQNVLQHSKEVAYLAGIMASELGADYDDARRAGLLHDIGKAIDRDVEGTHAQLGADMLKKFGEPEKVVNAAATHHGYGEPTSVEAVLVAAADAISAARPGARREPLENYIKRITELEELADSFSGVSKAYAIQAGREVRIIVEQERLDDAEAAELAYRIAKKIEEEMDYPGKIKVVVIRETRAVEYAS